MCFFLMWSETLLILVKISRQSPDPCSCDAGGLNFTDISASVSKHGLETFTENKRSDYGQGDAEVKCSSVTAEQAIWYCIIGVSRRINQYRQHNDVGRLRHTSPCSYTHQQKNIRRSTPLRRLAQPQALLRIPEFETPPGPLLFLS